MVPELEFDKAVERGELIDLAPKQPTDVESYRHAWQVQSPRLESHRRASSNLNAQR